MHAYRIWRTEKEDGEAEVPGFGKGIFLDEVRKYGHVLMPGRYDSVESQVVNRSRRIWLRVAPRFQPLAENE